MPPKSPALAATARLLPAPSLGTHFEPVRSADARVLLFSERNTQVHMWEAPQLEFEDVIGTVDAVDMIAPRFAWKSGIDVMRDGLMNQARRALGRRKEWPVEPVEIDRDYDLFFAVFHFPPNIAYVEKLRGLRKRCRVMACFLVEMWSREIPGYASYLRLLQEFDHVFLLNGASAPNVQAVVGRPCHFLPTATDTIRFSPYPRLPDRSIDVYAIGRGSAMVHDQLLGMAERDEIFYVHSTVNHALPDYRAHRVQVANLMKRSRYFPAWRINESRMALTGGEEALATRFFEGAAGGAVMLGSRPRCREFDECFDWPDAVLPLPWESDRVAETLAELDAQPERLARIRRDNVVHSLRRHDWVHRWARVLDTVGLAHTPAMAERRARLDALADLAAAAGGAPHDRPSGALAATPR